MKSKILAGLTALLMVVAVPLSLTGCGSEEVPVDLSQFSYYKQPNAAEIIYTVKRSDLTDAEWYMILSLQGIVAQTEAQIWVEEGNYGLWAETLTDEFGVTFQPVEAENGERAAWVLVDKFKDHLSENGYVSFSFDDRSANVATTVAGMEKWLMIDESLEAEAQSHGLVKKMDGKSRTEAQIFETYRDRLNKSLLFHVDDYKMNVRDYCIATQSFCFYYVRGVDDAAFLKEVLDWADDNVPILGWTDDELDYVTQNSAANLITMGADWCSNFSLLSAFRLDRPLEQKTAFQPVTADPDKHYLTIVMSDGDNMTWHTGEFTTSPQWYGNSYRGQFPMNWGINPSFYDLAPTLLEREYEMATPNDAFITGVSGTGYINATGYPDLKTFAAQTNEYMKRCDLHVLNLLDNYVNPDAIVEFAKQPQIKGGLWMVGNKYTQGGGGVYWSNDKPFITFRDSMWEESPVRTATRINTYKRDPSVIEGYTVLVIHAWSADLNDVYQMVQNLEDHVEIVTAEQMIDLVTKNVAHEDVEVLDDNRSFDYPEEPQIDVQEIYHQLAAPKADFDFGSDAEEFVLKSFSMTDAAAYVPGEGTEGTGALLLEGKDVAAGGDSRTNAFAGRKLTVPADATKLQIRLRTNLPAGVRFRVSILNHKGLMEYPADWSLITNTEFGLTEWDLSAYAGRTIGVILEFNDTGTGEVGKIWIDSVRFI